MRRGRSKSRKLHRRKGTTMILSSLLFSIIISLAFGTFFSSAEEETSSQKYYRSVQIESGDSLWSICEEHMPDEYHSVIDYMSEIAQINQIPLYEFDTIYEGDFLTISYYE